MADRVHAALERMLPELEDLEKRGLFSREEVRSIANARTDFEYKIKRVYPLKSDFEKYVEYELKLERLRCIRKKKIISEQKGKRFRWRKSISDWACGKRVAYIYKRALRKFQGDMSLWLEFLEFCRKRGMRRNMQEAIALVLRLHPTKPSVWIYAAAWEFETNLNVAAARTLMQRAIRMCPKSEELWLEYLRMEITNAKKIKLRRLVLGLDKPASNPSIKQLEVPPPETDSDLTQKTKSGSALIVDVVSVIYKNAIESIPGNFKFRFKILETLHGENLLELSGLVNEICDGIRKDFPKEPEVWDFLSKHTFDMSKMNQNQNGVTGANDAKADYLNALALASKVYEEGLRLSPSTELFEFYEKFLGTALENSLATPEEEDADVNHERQASKPKKVASKIIEDLLSLYDWALASNMSSDAMKERHLALMLRCGQVDDARQLAIALCGGKYCASSHVWCAKLFLDNLRFEFLHNHSDEERRRKSSVKSLMEKALKIVPKKNSMPLWTMLLPHMYQETKNLDECIDYVEYFLASNSREKPNTELSCWMIDFVFQIGGYEYAKRACDRFLSLPGPSIELFQKSIEIESLALFCNHDDHSSNKNSNLRSRFESAITNHGKDNPDLWIQYCKSELTLGNFDAANSIFWRAKKQLKNPSTFIQTYNQILTNQL